MSKLIILNGPPATGKSTWKRRWLAAEPYKRRAVSSIETAYPLLGRGYDVVIDLEGNDHDIEVKTFTINEKEPAL